MKGKKKQTIGIVLGKTVNLRVDASARASILSRLSKGEQVEVLTRKGDWHKVRTHYD